MICLETHDFFAETVGARVEYKTLAPDGVRAGAPLPLVLHLHGAMSSSASLAAAEPAYAAAWAQGVLPPAVVACASTPTLGGFYMDYPGGPQWETLLADELPRRLAGQYSLMGHSLMGKAALIGFSMGGYGALKLALRRPEAFAAVAALCPVIFPADAAADVPARNRPSILGDLNAAMGADAETYSRNCVPALLSRNADAVRAADLRIFLDCGDADEFHLHDGAVYLHERLKALAIAHVFRSVSGARHADEQAPARQDAAIRFLGEALKGGPADPT